MDVVLITGNQNKADWFSKTIGIDIEHIKIDLDEIQSLDLKEVVEHKVRQAYDIVKRPVIVEDVALEFKAFGRIPGPFIKFFVEELTLQELCDLVANKSREAIARCVLGYYDGENLEMFEGELSGTIATHSSGVGGWDWDKIFIPESYTITRGELTEEEYQKTYLKYKRIDLLKEFLINKK